MAIAAALAFGVVVTPRYSQAQSVAKMEFKAAKQKFDEGAYDEALQMFQIAWEHSHSPNARLYIARSFSMLGNHKAAYDEFRGTLRDANDKVEEDEKYLATRNAAAAELILLEPKLGRVIIAPDPAVPDATIVMNDYEVPAISIGEPITVEPGRKTVVAKAEGREDVSMVVDVPGGSVVAAPIRFPPVVEKEADTSKAPVAPVEKDEPLTILQIAGIGTMALGGATLVLAAVSGGAAASKLSALETTCGGATCSDPATADVVDSGKLFETLAYVGIGVGAAAVLGGGAMFIWGGPTDGGDQMAGMTPLPGGGAALSYGLTF
jgi:hypothetical protein